MMRHHNDAASSIAVSLAKINIESTDGWVSPDEVITFIDKIYNYLTSKSDGEP